MDGAKPVAATSVFDISASALSAERMRLAVIAQDTKRNRFDQCQRTNGDATGARQRERNHRDRPSQIVQQCWNHR